MKRKTRAVAKTDLQRLAVELTLPRYTILEIETLTSCKTELGSGGYLEFGYHWYDNHSKMAFFCHFKLPRIVDDIVKGETYLLALLARDEKMEVYLNEELYDDVQNKVRYDRNHKWVRNIKTMPAAYLVAQEIKVLRGEGKYSTLNPNKRIDYDFLYEKI